jgi:hypothetical protein
MKTDNKLQKEERLLMLKTRKTTRIKVERKKGLNLTFNKGTRQDYVIKKKEHKN